MWINIWRFNFYHLSVWENDAEWFGECVVSLQTVVVSGSITTILSKFLYESSTIWPWTLCLLFSFLLSNFIAKKKMNNAIHCKTGLMPQASIFCGIVNTKMPCWLLALTNRKVAHDQRPFICSLCRRFLSSNFFSDDLSLFLRIL